MSRAPRLLIAAAGALGLVAVLATARTATDRALPRVSTGPAARPAAEQVAPVVAAPVRQDDSHAVAVASAAPSASPARPDPAPAVEIDPEIVEVARLVDQQRAAARRGNDPTAASPAASSPVAGVGLPQGVGGLTAPVIDFVSPDRQPPRTDPRRAGGVWINCAPGTTVYPDHPAPKAPDGSG